jgi:4'-phosphopantetheinyl transferase
MDFTEKEEGLKLQAGEVDVWLTSTSSAASVAQASYLELLSSTERTRWHRFASNDARLQYLVTRALVRTALSKYADVSAHEWQFESNAYGRPKISEPRASRNLCFNLSNATGLVGCAISRDCEIGLDIENCTRMIDFDALAPSVFAPAELADLSELPFGERRGRFFSYWTLKESYIKARGMGLSIPLDTFWFKLGGELPLLCVEDRCTDVPERWRFYQFAPTDQHVMAIAVAASAGIEPVIRLRWVTPLSQDVV